MTKPLHIKPKLFRIAVMMSSKPLRLFTLRAHTWLEQFARYHGVIDRIARPDFVLIVQAVVKSIQSLLVGFLPPGLSCSNGSLRLPFSVSSPLYLLAGFCSQELQATCFTPRIPATLARSAGKKFIKSFLYLTSRTAQDLWRYVPRAGNFLANCQLILAIAIFPSLSLGVLSGMILSNQSAFVGLTILSLPLFVKYLEFFTIPVCRPGLQISPSTPVPSFSGTIDFLATLLTLFWAIKCTLGFFLIAMMARLKNSLFRHGAFLYKVLCLGSPLAVARCAGFRILA